MKQRLIISYFGNLFDMIATLHLYYNYDGDELNPIAAWTLQRSPWYFVLYKLGCMTLLTILVWWKRDWLISKIASWMVCISYAAISVYYIIVYIILIM